MSGEGYALSSAFHVYYKSRLLILCSFLCLIVLHNKQSNIFQHNKYVGMGKYELVCAGTGSILHRITLKYVGMGL